ncbi:MAG: tetratricopeptide repeat protein [Bacteroidetes bacterium]|nr:tetratricopeptide repeat protein [Bacteroidota bacterium]
MTIFKNFPVFIVLVLIGSSCSFFKGKPEESAGEREQKIGQIRVQLQSVADSFNTGGFEFVCSKLEELKLPVSRYLPLESAWLSNTRGLSFFYLERNDSALAEFNVAVTLDPVYTEAWNNLGHIFLLRGDIDSAISSFKRSLSLNKDYDAARLNLEIAELFKSGQLKWGELGLMAIADSTKNPEEKVRIYAQLLNLAPYYVQIYNNLAVAEYKTGNINSAFQHLSAAVILDPTYAMAHHNLAYIYHEYGLYDDAIRHYLIAIRHQFNFFTALENLAYTYLVKGDLGNARLVINRVLDVAPDRTYAKELNIEISEAEMKPEKQELK